MHYLVKSLVSLSLGVIYVVKRRATFSLLLGHRNLSRLKRKIPAIKKTFYIWQLKTKFVQLEYCKEKLEKNARIFSSSKWEHMQSYMKHKTPDKPKPFLEIQTTGPQFSRGFGQWFPGWFGPWSSLLLLRLRSFFPLGPTLIKPNLAEPSLVLGVLHSLLIMESDPK